MRPLPWFLFALALVGVVGLSLHTRELAQHLGEERIRARDLEREAEREAERAAARTAEVEAGLRESIRGLEQRLEGALGREQEVLALLEDRLERDRAEREARAEQRDRWSRPMPEGVRLYLVSLHECLAQDGYSGMRFVRAMGLDDGGLRDVEMFDQDPARLTSVLFLAGRMTATLDRSRGSLELRFHDGHRVADGRRVELPEEGYPLTLESVYGPMWEARLPLLVRAEGTYPEEDGDRSEPKVDMRTRYAWQGRLDALLDTARYNDLRLRVAGFRDMEGPWFHGAEVVGYGEDKLLTMTASVDRLAVEVDPDTGIVNLLLSGGTLRRKGGESTISDGGLRMLLDRVTPERASDLMLGMVVKR